MSKILEISELVKTSVLCAIDFGYTKMKYGKCKAFFVHQDGGILVQIESLDSVGQYQLSFDKWYNTNELFQSLALMGEVTAFLIAHNTKE